MKLNYYPDTTKYVDVLEQRTAEIYELLSGYIEYSFKSIESFDVVGMKNFMPIYQIIGEKDGNKIKLKIWTSEVTNKQTHLTMSIYKPHYKNADNWKFLYKTTSYDEYFIAKQIKQVA